MTNTTQNSQNRRKASISDMGGNRIIRRFQDMQRGIDIRMTSHRGRFPQFAITIIRDGRNTPQTRTAMTQDQADAIFQDWMNGNWSDND